MKRFSKIFINVIAVIMIVCSVCMFSACEDIKTLEVTLNVYDADTKVVEEKTMELKLYRHLAPKTVDAIIKYVNEGYYNDTIIYKDEDETKQMFFGDLKKDVDGVITQNLDNGLLKDAIDGEFTINGVSGSDLKNVEGAVGLWRTWKSNYDINEAGSLNSGRATVYMLSNAISDYNDYFTVFAKVNEDDETSSATWEDLKTAVNNSSIYEDYIIYYTGEYDKDAKLNNGLEFHCVKKSVFNEEIKDNKDIEIFESEDNEYSCYDQMEIRVPALKVDANGQSVLAFAIKSVKVK